MSQAQFPQPTENLTEKDFERIQANLDTLRDHVVLKKMDGSNFSLSPAAGIAGTQIASSELLPANVKLKTITTTQISSGFPETNWEDECFTHDTMNWASVTLLRDPQEGWAVLAGSATGTIASGTSGTTVSLLAGDQPPRKTLQTPVRGFIQLAASGATFCSHPISMRAYNLSTSGMDVELKTPQNVSGAFAFTLYWIIWSGVLP